jgi:biofilm PGA synthesis protein PgaD
MNQQILILTEHRMLPRLFDGVLTAIAWTGFAFFLYANLLMQFTERSNDNWDAIMASFNTVLVYLLVAAINGWLLILWYQYNLRRYNARRHSSMASLRHEELAESFNIAPQIISG